MRQKNNQNQININAKEVLKKIFILLLLFWTYSFFKWFIVDVYKPQEKNYIRKVKIAHNFIQSELSEYYKKNGYIFESQDDIEDKFCLALKKKYGDNSGSCQVDGTLRENIHFKNTNITMYGFSRKPQIYNNVLVKDVVIDIDGEKGKNKFGVDRAPIRIYSKGLLGGMITPVNCNREDNYKYDVPYSDICPIDDHVNYMDTQIPFAYNVLQIGGKRGRSRYLNKKVSFFRAECVAFGGEMLGAVDYCDYKKYQWLTACYHEYRCAIELNKKRYYK